MVEKPSLKTVAVIGGGVVLAVGGAVVLLPALGFTAAGVGAGTLAAGVQSSIGNVAAGSAFALLQSAGVVGLATSTKVAIGVAGGATALAAKSYLDTTEVDTVDKEVGATNLSAGGPSSIGNVVAGSTAFLANGLTAAAKSYFGGGGEK